MNKLAGAGREVEAPPAGSPDRASDAGTGGVRYEARLDRDSAWALGEGSRHFEGRSAVQDALRRIARRLDELGIPYAVAGGMALFQHGYRRFTEDVDLLVTRDGLTQAHQHLEGLGYRPAFPGSRNLRDSELGVRIEFLVAGEFPGDGRPKPVAFPDPISAGFRHDGVSYVNLPSLIETKLAAGITEPGRMKDLADVQEMVRILNLPREMSEQIHPFVRNRYVEIWQATRSRFARIWRVAQAGLDVATFQELLAACPDDAAILRAMRADGVDLDPTRATMDGGAYLWTVDPEVALRWDMQPATELWGGADGEDEVAE